MEQFHHVEQSTQPPITGEDQTSLPRWQVLEADLKALDTQIDGMELDFTQDPQYTPHFDRLWETEKALEDTLGRQPSRREVIEALETPLPEAMHTGLMSFVALSEERETLLSKLDTYKAEKYAALHDKIHAYEQRIDYKEVFRNALAEAPNKEPHENKFQSAIFMRYRLRGDISKTDYQGLLNLESLIDSDFNSLKEDGLLRDSPEAVPSPEDTDKEMGFIRNADVYITEVERLQKAYRSVTNRDEAHWKAMRTILDLQGEYVRAFDLENVDPNLYTLGQRLMLQSIGDVLQDTVDTIPDVDKSLSVKSDAYRDFCEQVRAIDVQSAVEAIEFSGMTSETDIFMTQDELKEYLRTTCLPLAVSHTRKVMFTEIEQDEEKETVSLASHFWDETLGGSVITICPKQLKEDYDMALEVFKDHPDAHESALFYVKQRLNNTLRHEFSHTLHNVLPYAALKKWDTVTKADTTPVTSYIHRERTADRHSADFEDFADSAARFHKSPVSLMTLSHMRYTTLEDFYRDFYPDFDSSSLKRNLTIRFNVEYAAFAKTGKDLMTYRNELLTDITRSSKKN